MEHPAQTKVQGMKNHEADSIPDDSEIKKEEEQYARYHSSAKQLLDYCTEVDEHITSIEDFKRERIRNKRLAIGGLLVGIASVIISIILLLK
jgi:hypothetical protein